MKRIISSIAVLFALACLLVSCADVSDKATATTSPVTASVTETVKPSVSLTTQTPEPFDHSKIKMQIVDSSALSKVGYDSTCEVLKVQFKDSGEYYIYYDVPRSVYQDLLGADSIGSFFYYNIRMEYEYEKVS